MPLAIWLILIATAVLLASFSPAWVVALFIPLAASISLFIRQRESRFLKDRLAKISELVGSPATNDSAINDDAEPTLSSIFDAIEKGIEHQDERTQSSATRETERTATLNAYLNAVDTPIIATAADGRLALLNRQARKLFDSVRLEEASLTIQDLVGNPEVLALHAKAAAGEACRARVRLALGKLPRFYDVSATPVRLSVAEIPAHIPQRPGVVLTLRDVHALAQTLQLRTDFAANASHELRTPIASIKTAIETLRGAAADDPKMHAKLEEVIENNATRLEETVDDLLDLSRLESEEAEAEFKSFDAIALCESLRHRFETVCERRQLRIEIHLDSEFRRVTTDRKRLELILRNLIDNATKFAFEGTSIVVRGEVLRSASPGLDSARFHVTDRGIGIPLKHQTRVFERFFQVDESRARIGGRRGSGLGLAIVRHALRSIDGDIKIESVWQEGTTMTVTLPRCIDVASQ